VNKKKPYYHAWGLTGCNDFMTAKSLLKSFKYAADGITYCLLTQRNMKIHTAAAIAALALAWYFELPATEIIVLILTIAAVMVAEMINTAIETLVDLISPQYHPLAKVAKNIAAGAVLVSSVASIAVGFFLFFHRLIGC